MIDDVRNILDEAPFEPFAVITSSGHRYLIPTADHVGINPKGNRLIIWFDNGSGVTISSLHIAAVEKLALPKRGKKSGK